MPETVSYDDAQAQKQFSVELKSDTLKALTNIISALVDEVKGEYIARITVFQLGIYLSFTVDKHGQFHI